MNIKTLYFICDKFFEMLHPNNAETDDYECESENIDDIIEDITNDYEYLHSRANDLVVFLREKVKI
jgi:hypothetical protein